MQAKRRDNPVKMVIIEVEGRSRGWSTMRWMDAIRRDVGDMGTLMDRIKSRFHATNFPYGCYCDVYDTLIKVQREGKVLQHMPGNHEKE